jgi:hypothetical protein
MHVLIVFLLIVVGGLVVGSAYLLLAEIRHLRGSGGVNNAALLEPLRAALDARYEAELERLRAQAQRVLGDLDTELGRLREQVRSSSDEHETHIIRLRERYTEADDRTVRAVDQTLRDLQSHHDSELSRLREAIGTAIATIAARQAAEDDDRVSALRITALSDLYSRLTKLETAFTSIANPVLLPGESFTIPEELPSQVFRWEHWKDVGDATFSFAEEFARQRVHLDNETCREMTAFIGSARSVLTRSIYPNLQNGGANGETQKEILRTAIQQLADDITTGRENLERSYRERAERH